ncbi:phage scaffolding protein [Enterococcus gallinarum]|uniref:phage scaffolding protein n=1 Tax=Enterococcus gallinarum TaxID=1353 RepID=UPI00243398B8|nr:phage scaffolding protein [Enterococcus gallinarum]
MKKEDLLNLGIDEEVAKQVMALHGTAITKAKADAASKDETIVSLQGQLTERDKDLKQLQKSVKDNEDLSNQLKNWQDKYNTDTQALNDQIAKAKFDNALNEALGKTKARDPKDIRALLNMDEVKLDESGKVVGLESQLETLQKEKAYLFDMGQQQGGYQPGNGSSKTIPADLVSAMKDPEFNMTNYLENKHKGEN